VHQYGVREVEKLLRLPRSTVRALVDAGFASPARGPRGAWQFSFQDLIVLRKAQALLAARVPARRIARAMKELRRQAESGQYSLAFEGDPGPGALKVMQRKTMPAEKVAAPIDLGYALHEAGRLAEAEVVYRGALDTGGADPALLYNLGVLLEDLERKPEALVAYQAALRGDPALADCHYNLALLYENLGRKKEAIRHLAQYRRLTRSRPK
jgi:tetratricopeptide (TPR) repeat protein